MELWLFGWGEAALEDPRKEQIMEYISVMYDSLRAAVLPTQQLVFTGPTVLQEILDNFLA